MTRGILLTTAAFVMLAAPAFAQVEDKCMGPIAPVVPNGKTADAATLGQAAKDVVAFIKASDEYQNCLLTEISTYEKEAKDSKQPVDASVRRTLMAKGDANQKAKERIGKEYNTAAAAYKAAHK
jgi:hypothetical protein